jgi:hypothetical protein
MAQMVLTVQQVLLVRQEQMVPMAQMVPQEQQVVPELMVLKVLLVEQAEDMQHQHPLVGPLIILAPLLLQLLQMLPFRLMRLELE